MPSDIELLRRFCRDGSEQAFSQLVSLRMSLVYSVALRQTNGDSHLAQDVAQTVFADLAKKGRELCRLDSLGGWLCKAAQFAAIDAVRGEARRRDRERAVANADTPDPSPEDAWDPLRPELDRLVSVLPEKDREILISRFYDGRSFPEMAAAFRISEDGARKRVVRALEKLRAKLEKAGALSTTAALSQGLLGQVLSSVPDGLCHGASTAALAGSHAGLGTVAAAPLLMSKTTTLVVLVLLAAACSIGYVDHLSQAAKIQQLEQTVATLEHRHRGGTQASAPRQYAASGPHAIVTLTADDLHAASAMDRLDRIKERIKSHPEQNIPESRFLTDDDWMEVAFRVNPLESDADFTKALSMLRGLAEGHIQPVLFKALTTYVAASGGQLPADITQLTPYLDPPLEPAILSRYEMIATGSASKTDANAWAIALNPTAAVDENADASYYVTLNGWGSQGSGSEVPLSLATAIEAARQQYYRANGSLPADEHQIIPYLSDPAQVAAVTTLLAKRR